MCDCDRRWVEHRWPPIGQTKRDITMLHGTRGPAVGSHTRKGPTGHAALTIRHDAPSAAAHHALVHQEPPKPRRSWQRSRRHTAAAAAAHNHSSSQTPDSIPVFPILEQQGATAGLSSLDSSLQLAWSRATHTLSRVGLSSPQTHGSQSQCPGHEVPLVLDPYAQGLLSLGTEAQVECDNLTQLSHLLTTRYIDDTLLAAMEATNVNTINKGDYRQVVLVGDGLDTRPFRLPWPEGTLIFLVAPKAVHEAAVPVLKAAGARVPRGCLLRRVAYDHTHTDTQGSLAAALESSGYQADRLSVWAVQGLLSQQLSPEVVQGLLLDMTSCAAFNSLVLGEFPAGLSQQEVDNQLAQFGLLSTVLSLDHPSVSQGHWQAQHSELAAGRPPRWLFTGQQMRLSLAQEGIYEDHVNAQIDEDFFGNFS